MRVLTGGSAVGREVGMLDLASLAAPATWVDPSAAIAPPSDMRKASRRE